MLTLITPTGDRPEAFALCERWIGNQTYDGEYRWIVIDDGIIPTKITNSAIEYVRLEATNTNTQARNLLAALNLINLTEKIVIIEDDDYYSSNWLTIVSNYINDYELVGETESYYWHVKNRSYVNCANKKHASLCATALTGSAITYLKHLCSLKIKFIDTKLWNTFKGSKCLFKGRNVVGMKGLPGRKGIGGGHKTRMLKHTDPEGKELTNWIGLDAQFYINDSFR